MLSGSIIDEEHVEVVESSGMSAGCERSLCLEDISSLMEIIHIYIIHTYI